MSIDIEAFKFKLQFVLVSFVTSTMRSLCFNINQQDAEDSKVLGTSQELVEGRRRAFYNLYKVCRSHGEP